MVYVHLNLSLSVRIRILERGVLLHERVETFLIQVDRLQFQYPRGGLVEQWAILPTVVAERSLVVELELLEIVYLLLGFDGEVGA